MGADGRESLVCTVCVFNKHACIYDGLAYLLVEWGGEGDGKEEREHSVINTKFADLLHPANGYIAGADVSCRLKEGTFHATIITAG